jgi:hypothetical protein
MELASGRPGRVGAAAGVEQLAARATRVKITSSWVMNLTVASESKSSRVMVNQPVSVRDQAICVSTGFGLAVHDGRLTT